ncbi:LOW QUALITY PROTEIN: hypothetical protein CRUP_025037 [Coryphaenoides rupestris]|nr:LOW QUALITY PROTEIN: hypothetical protein CRUP_025037 [Coryphaenoides rupestris]
MQTPPHASPSSQSVSSGSNHNHVTHSSEFFTPTQSNRDGEPVGPASHHGDFDAVFGNKTADSNGGPQPAAGKTSENSPADRPTDRPADRCY